MRVTMSPFALQYTSLILIVLSFTIGTLVKPQMFEKQIESIPSVLPETLRQSAASDLLPAASAGLEKPQPLIGAIEYQDLFAGQGAQLAEDKLIALAQVLKEHDLVLDLSIFTAPSGADDLSVNLPVLAVEQSIAVARFFEAQAVPSSAFNIRVLEVESSLQARASFKREELDDVF